MDHEGGRGEPATAQDRPHRPVPGPPPRPRHRRRGDARRLTDLVRQGKIRDFGSSTFQAGRSRKRSGRRAPRARAFPLRQPPYSILARQIERDVLPVTSATGWASPLPRSAAAGSPASTGATTNRRGLTGRRAHCAASVSGVRPRVASENQRKFDPVEALRPVADKAGISMTHMAIAFTLHTRRSRRPSSGRGRWSSSRTCWRRPTSAWTRRRWTRSTSSPRRASHRRERPGVRRPVVRGRRQTPAPDRERLRQAARRAMKTTCVSSEDAGSPE